MKRFNLIVVIVLFSSLSGTLQAQTAPRGLSTQLEALQECFENTSLKKKNRSVQAKGNGKLFSEVFPEPPQHAYYPNAFVMIEGKSGANYLVTVLKDVNRTMTAYRFEVPPQTLDSTRAVQLNNPLDPKFKVACGKRGNNIEATCDELPLTIRLVRVRGREDVIHTEFVYKGADLRRAYQKAKNLPATQQVRVTPISGDEGLAAALRDATLQILTIHHRIRSSSEIHEVLAGCQRMIVRLKEIRDKSRAVDQEIRWLTEAIDSIKARTK